MSVIFCHGLESGPHGNKFRALTEAGLEVESPDFKGMNFVQRTNYLLSFLELRREVVLVGSSFGGAVAAVASAFSQAVRGLVLCAPSMEHPEVPPLHSFAPAIPCSVTIIHGVYDEVVPFSVSARFLEGLPGRNTLISVEDGHRLSSSADLVVSETRKAADLLEGQADRRRQPV